mgnify:CR=1 FL=1
MKKKSLITLGIILAIIVITFAVYMLNGIPVKKLSDAKILDCYGTEIENYQQNKMPFTVEKQNENQVIKVNGKKCENGERFYKVGTYKVQVYNNLKVENTTVEIKDIEKNPNSEYTIYINTSTLPTFMAMLDISKNDDVKGFFWTQKNTSIDVEGIKNRNKNLKISENIGCSKEDEFKKALIPEIKDYIRDVLQKDENAFFNLYVDDYRFYLGLELFGKIGLGDNRYEYIYYSDGTSSYVKDYASKTGFIHREYKMRERNGYDDFVREKQEYNEIVDKMRNNQLAYDDIPGSFLADSSGNGYNFDYMLISLLKDNVKYLLQYPQMIDFKDEKVAEEMKNANFVKIDLKKQFSELSAEQKQTFLSNIFFDKAQFDENYFTDENGKYLIITGANPFYGNMDKEQFERIMKEARDDYGEEYTLLYKPHPSALPDAEQQKFLDSLNIKTLPGRMPMEAIMFIYPNIKLGGFASSLYMSAEEGQTEFFFAKDSRDLVEPLNMLYTDLFGNAKFYK